MTELTGLKFDKCCWLHRSVQSGLTLYLSGRSESEEEGGREGKVWRCLLEVIFLWVHHYQFSCVMSSSLLRYGKIVLKTSCKFCKDIAQQNCLKLKGYIQWLCFFRGGTLSFLITTMLHFAQLRIAAFKWLQFIVKHLQPNRMQEQSKGNDNELLHSFENIGCKDVYLPAQYICL